MIAAVMGSSKGRPIRRTVIDGARRLGVLPSVMMAGYCNSIRRTTRPLTGECDGWQRTDDERHTEAERADERPHAAASIYPPCAQSG